MGISLKSVLELSGAILKLTPAAPIGAAVDLGADLFPDDKPDERAWKVKMIPEWKKLAVGLMEIPMQDEVRGRVLKDKMKADFFTKYGEFPKDRFIDRLSSDVVIAVKAEMAATMAATIPK